MDKEVIRIIPVGLEELGQRIAVEKARGRDVQELMVRISGILSDAAEKNVAAQGRPDRWPDLAESTKRSRARRGKWPGQIMVDSAQLVASMQPGSSASSAWIGTNKIYGPIQHFGGEIKRQPFSGTVRLRVDARGNLLHQGADGRKKYLAVFASKKHKRAETRAFSSQGWAVKIPARPVLVLAPDDVSLILATAAEFFAAGK